MVKQIIYSEKAPLALGPYSQATAFGNLIFVSGQIALNPETGNLEGNDAGDQTKIILENIKHILQSAKSDLNKVLKCEVYLTNMQNFSAVNGVYETFFEKNNYPARVTVGVNQLPKNALVEISCIAFV